VGPVPARWLPTSLRLVRKINAAGKYDVRPADATPIYVVGPKDFVLPTSSLSTLGGFIMRNKETVNASIAVQKNGYLPAKKHLYLV